MLVIDQHDTSRRVDLEGISFQPGEFGAPVRRRHVFADPDADATRDDGRALPIRFGHPSNLQRELGRYLQPSDAALFDAGHDVAVMAKRPEVRRVVGPAVFHGDDVVAFKRGA